MPSTLLNYDNAAIFVALTALMLGTCLGACAAQSRAVQASRIANASVARALDVALDDELVQLRALARLRASACTQPDPAMAKTCRHAAVEGVFLEAAPYLARLKRAVEAQHILDDALTAWDACEAQEGAAHASLPCAEIAAASVLEALPEVLEAIRAYDHPPARTAPASSSAVPVHSAAVVPRPVHS